MEPQIVDPSGAPVKWHAPIKESKQAKKRRLFKVAFEVVSKEYSLEPRKARRRIAWNLAKQGRNA